MTPGETADTTPTIPQDKYASLPTGDLVLFAVQRLHADGLPATVEEIVSTCFKLFPHRFSLKKYFYWPDSAHVAQALKYAKEKGYVKDGQAEGLVLRPAGRKIAKHAAKALGLAFPMPPKVEKPTADDRPQTVKKVGKKAKPKQTPKTSGAGRLAAEATEAGSLTPKKKKKAPAPKKAAPAKKKTAAKPKKTAAKPALKPKAQPKKPAVGPVAKKKTPIRKAVKKSEAAAQLPLPAPAAPKKEAGKPVIEPIPAVSKEEKAKAGKVIKMVERSDAYRQYKKLGAKARISEFDFRDMLFATMESSAETLRRNVDLFKRYAGIHNRADLIKFLEFAEGNFAPLLSAQPKRKK